MYDLQTSIPKLVVNFTERLFCWDDCFTFVENKD